MAEIQGALRFFVIACAFISFVLAAARWRIASWASVAAPLYIQDCLLVIFLILATNRSVITPRKRTMIIASVLVAAKILSDILIPFIAEGKLQGSVVLYLIPVYIFCISLFFLVLESLLLEKTN